MNNYTARIKNSTRSDLEKIKHSYLKKLFLEVIEILENDPYEIAQSPGKLGPKYLERYSRRIDHQCRIIHTVDDRSKEVLILSAWLHHD